MGLLRGGRRLPVCPRVLQGRPEVRRQRLALLLQVRWVVLQHRGQGLLLPRRDLLGCHAWRRAQPRVLAGGSVHGRVRKVQRVVGRLRRWLALELGHGGINWSMLHGWGLLHRRCLLSRPACWKQAAAAPQAAWQLPAWGTARAAAAARLA
jgi:hypothetical protein